MGITNVRGGAMEIGFRRPSRPLFVSLLVLGSITLCPSPAGAGTLVDTATNCHTYTFEQPFARWADQFEYVLSPDGGFERRARRWTLTGSARVVPGNETYRVHRRSDSRSLSLRGTSSATSPSMCVGLEYPTLRAFALNRRSLLSTLRVEVLFEDPVGTGCLASGGILGSGDICSLTIGLLTASSSWEPTVPLPVVANLLPLLPGNRTAVAFRFSPQGAAGDWRIDDVYVDPYRTR
jgi:hypothetical protein